MYAISADETNDDGTYATSYIAGITEGIRHSKYACAQRTLQQVEECLGIAKGKNKSGIRTWFLLHEVSDCISNTIYV